MNRCLDVIHAHLDGRLSPQQTAEFYRWLAASPRNARAFAVIALVDWQLLEYHRAQNIDLDVSDLPRLMGIESDDAGAGPAFTFDDLALLEELAPQGACEPVVLDSEAANRHSTLPADAAHLTSRRLAGSPQKPMLSAFGIRVYRGTADRSSAAPSFGWPARAATLAAVAALLLLGAMLLFSSNTPPIQRDAPPTSTPNLATGNVPSPDSPTPASEVPASVMATVLRTQHARWQDEAPLQSGMPLNRDQRIELTHGAVELAMQSGATLLVESPTTFWAVDENTVYLERGRITATVPHRAVHFTIDTPTARVIDLGTRFGVHVGEDRHTLAAVFEGTVELREAMTPANPYPRVAQLVGGLAGTVDGNGQMTLQLESIAGEIEASFAQHWSQLDAGCRTSGAIAFIDEPLPQPTDVTLNGLESDEYIHVLRERRGLVLTSDLTVTSLPPTGQRLAPTPHAQTTIPAGTSIDVYLVHADSINDKRLTLEGIVEFNRPILGLIVDGDAFAASTERFHHPHVLYKPMTKLLELEDGDSISVSQDQQALFIALSLAPHLDQFRVIVAAQLPDEPTNP